MSSVQTTLLARTDVLIIGSGLEALQSALKAAEDHKVFLAGAMPFPAWELTGRWEFDQIDWRKLPFLKDIPVSGKYPTPAAVKHAVFAALDEAGVEFAGGLFYLGKTSSGALFAGTGKVLEIKCARLMEHLLSPAPWQSCAAVHAPEGEPDWISNGKNLQKKINCTPVDRIAGTFPDGETDRHTRQDELPENISLSGEGNKKQSLPFLAVEPEIYDCIVTGGGTAGAAAAAAAAREGGKVLLLERFAELGGLSTMGRITNHFFGNRVGFAAEVDRTAAALSNGKYNEFDGSWRVEAKKFALRQLVQEAGVTVKFNQEICGALKKGRTVCGVLSASFDGLTAYWGKTVIDATGNADLAAAAGAKCEFIDDEPALQGTGVPAVVPGEENSNSDFTFTSNQSALDVTRTLKLAAGLFKEKFDFGPMIDTRERRRICADFTITPADAYARREYADCIVRCRSRFDTHGFMTDRIFELNQPSNIAEFVEIPYRALLPAGLENLLVTGLGMGASRDAMPFMRMQPDVLNQGYAAGIAAMIGVRSRRTLRKISVSALQKKLIKKEILPRGYDRRVSRIPDIFPLPQDVQNILQSVGAILLEPKKYLPELKRRFLAGKDLRYAQLLAMLEDSTGAEVLAQEVQNYPFARDIPGWDFRGMGQSGRCASRIDTIIHSLARLKEPFAADGVLERLNEVEKTSGLSHFRSCCYYLMKHPDPRAAGQLEKLLSELLAEPVVFSCDPLDTQYRNWRLKCFYLAGALYKISPQHQAGKEFLENCLSRHEGALAECAEKLLNGRI